MSIIAMSRRSIKEIGVFVGLVGFMHFTYYKIQANPSLISPEERQELFYIKWLKDRIPALKGIGIQEEEKKE